MKPGQATSTRFTPLRANAFNVGSVYGSSHLALPKRDWKETVYCSGCSDSQPASSRPVLWHSQW